MRILALVAPLLSLLYGVLRFFGKLDGAVRDGWTWTVGHVAFFISMALFAALAVVLRARTPARHRAVATVATVAALLGAGCFLWVIAGDLNDTFHERWPLPGVLQVPGPLLFVLGSVTLLILRVVDRRLPWWSPALFLAGYVAISVNLDLLPLGTSLVLLACLPLVRSSAQ